MAKTQNLVGIQEIAVIARVSRQAIVNWRGRFLDSFPRPIADLASGPVFDRQAVEKWLESNRGLAFAGMVGRYVDATHILRWSDRRDAQGKLPELIRRLVRETGLGLLRADFPSGESVQLPGYDGWVESAERSEFVPSGVSLWELSTEQRPAVKAEEDYQKRTIEAPAVDRSRATLVLVTSRRWGTKKHAWEAAKRRTGAWADIRVYDADDLAQWIELAPTTRTWFGKEIGIRSQGMVNVEDFWAECATQTNPPLHPGIYMAGRRPQAEAVTRWLADPIPVFALRGDTREEVAAFFAAILITLPEALKAQLLPRVLVVRDADALRELFQTGRSLILVPLFEAPAVGLAERYGHKVFVPHGSDSAASPGVSPLARSRSRELVEALQQMEISEERAEKLARDSGGRVDVLVRTLGLVGGGVRPQWARAGDGPRLAPLLLAGAWDAGAAEDRDAVERIVGQSYNEISSHLERWANEPESPVRKIGELWKWVSRRDSWTLLSEYLTRQQIEAFEAVAVDVLSILDPRYDLAPNERWLAAAKGRARPFSSQLREGIAETLALLATQEPGRTNHLGEARARNIVRKLLGDRSDWKAWASLSDVLPLLAEAAPDSFIEAAKEALLGKPDALKEIFAEEEPFFGGSTHTHLLWALETLAWAPEYLGAVSVVLGQLAEGDPGGRLANRPVESLCRIFLPWFPQTAASWVQRLEALEVLHQRTPTVAWRVHVDLLPQLGGSATHPTAKPHWREWPKDWKAGATRGEYWKTVDELLSRLVSWADTSAEGWANLAEKIDSLPRHHQEQIVTRLEELEPSGNEDCRDTLRKRLRVILHRHRQFPHAGWALPEQTLSRLEAVYHRLEPVDLVKRLQWLFSFNPELPDLRTHDWQEGRDAIERTRLTVIEDLRESDDSDVLKRLRSEVEDPGALGSTVGRCGYSDDAVAALLDESLSQHDQKALNFALGVGASRFEREGWEWVDKLLASPIGGAWSAEVRGQFACLLPFGSRTWDVVASWGQASERAYWGRVGAYWLENPAADGERALRSLLAVNRPYAALHLLDRCVGSDGGTLMIPVELAVSVLERAAATNPADEKPAPHIASVEYQVERVVGLLARSGNVGSEALATLEWIWLPVFTAYGKAPIHLHKRLCENPHFFVEVLSKIFLAEGETAPEPVDEQVKRVAENAYRLLDSWSRLPGVLEEGHVNTERLRTWVDEARAKSAEAGRAKIADDRIGALLAHSPNGSDGAWPHEAVRDVLEIGSKELRDGFAVGAYNRRGAYSKSLDEGGSQERQLASGYRGHAERLARWPATAALLRRIADGYDVDARREDLAAEYRTEVG